MYNYLVSFSLHLQSRTAQVASALESAMNAPAGDLAQAALAIARIEYPSLEPREYIGALDRMGAEAADRIERAQPGSMRDAIRALNEYLYDEQRFTGNREKYDDPRNNFLNEVLDRRTGIPITLAVVYLEVARRAGVMVDGVNFPGHFLLRAPDGGRRPEGLRYERHEKRSAGDSNFVIVDPFHGGAILSEVDCRELLRQHVGDEAAFDRGLLQPATRHHIIVRMLVNLKRLYVRMRSFPQARFVSDLLLTVDPSAVSELRDRGLLAYHLQDFGAALRDLEEYLRLLPKQSEGVADSLESVLASGEEGTENDQASQNSEVWEHVKTLRKRVAGFN
jgi:regulator of sirC expression with transglutaminase-like and TPR domain